MYSLGGTGSFGPKLGGSRNTFAVQVYTQQVHQLVAGISNFPGLPLKRRSFTLLLSPFYQNQPKWENQPNAGDMENEETENIL